MSAARVEALVTLGRWLAAKGYRFTTVTPATHALVNARHGAAVAASVRDIFGWSRSFARFLLPPAILETLQRAELVHDGRGLFTSQVRFSSVGDLLFAHSSYPTTQADAVFFGPDTYRFAALVANELRLQPLSRAGARILDVGCGSGAGGLLAARQEAAVGPRLVLADINPAALDHARANAVLAGQADVQFVQGDLYAPVEGHFDLVIANPPYLNDGAQRVYRHGGGPWGGGLSERIVKEGLPRLAPGGRLVLYTGTAIVDGADPLLEALRRDLEAAGWAWRYWELDPDVFGEELAQPAYARAERIAVVALVVQRPET